MLAVERRKKIVALITEHKSVMVLDLAKKFDVTPETIRGDLEKLEQQGVLVRTYGGATLLEENLPEIPLSQRESIQLEGKQRIGKFAASLIKEGETIFLDASTSSLHLARSLKEKKGIIVITNSEKIVFELTGCDDIKIICVGGIFRQKSMSYVGAVAEQNILEHYYANKVFLSGRGITLQQGLMDSNEQDAEVKKAMIARAEKVFVLCDKSKLGKLGFPVISPLLKIDTLITDILLDEKWQDTFDENEVEVISVAEA